MKKMLICFLILFLVGSVSAMDHYVRAGATGLNNGNDWVNAYTSLPSTLIRGDNYYIADGSYPSYIFDDALDGTKYIYIKKATVESHGVNIGWNNSYGDGQAVFTPSSLTRGGFWEFNTGRWSIDGVIGEGEFGHGFFLDGRGISSDNSKKGVKISPGISHINLSHVKIQMAGRTRTGHSGIYGVVPRAEANGFNGTRITDLHFSYLSITDTGGVLIHFIGADRAIIEHCFFARNYADPEWHGQGMEFAISGKVIYRYNTMVDSEGTSPITISQTDENGLLVFGNATQEYYGNIFYETPHGTLPKYHLSQMWFNSGSKIPKKGEKISGILSGKTAIVYEIVLESGSWSSGDAMGYIWLEETTGAFAYSKDANDVMKRISESVNCEFGGNDCLTATDHDIMSSGHSVISDWNVDSHANSVKVYNNVVVNVGGLLSTSGLIADFPGAMADLDKTGTIEVYNNIMYNCYITNYAWRGINHHDYNWFNNDANPSLGSENHIQISSENPFVDSENFDFHLKNSTNSGLNLESPYNIDMDGNKRVNWDRGAYEYVSGASIPSSDYHRADLDKDYKINLSEVGFFIGVWRGRVVSLSEVIVAIRIWSNGECYNEEACGASATTFVQSFEDEEVIEEPEIVEKESPIVPESSGDEVLWLKFDGDLSDSSGNSYNISCISCPTFIAGHSGQGAKFNGIDNVLNSSSLPVLTSKTISFWAKFDSYKTTGYSMIYADSASDYAGFSMDKSMRITWDNSTGGNEASSVINFIGELNTWNHYVIVFELDGESLKIRFYRNNVDSVTTISNSRGLAERSIVTIGARGSANFFDGTMDDIKIWNRALNEEEIRDLI